MSDDLAFALPIAFLLFTAVATVSYVVALAVNLAWVARHPRAGWAAFRRWSGLGPRDGPAPRSP